MIAQNRFLPMADSAVESAVRQVDKDRYAALDEVGFRNLLKERGIGYFAVLNICFHPVFGQLTPVSFPSTSSADARRCRIGTLACRLTARRTCDIR